MVAINPTLSVIMLIVNRLHTDQNPLHWDLGVLATGPPGKSLQLSIVVIPLQKFL